jgi:hypothetical protein
MRFVRLEVESFQGIREASVDFAPGLNVLHGRNDLGKSTLVRTMRAALLVPAASTEARDFATWQRGDVSPRVRLTFQQDDGRFWRVDKTFGHGSRAELFFSKDGSTFVADASAREVDEKLRTMLEWGVQPPGGKTGPKKVSRSFLVRVLLADQTDVDAILDTGLEDDTDESGRRSLTAALAALAEDPVFKQVLEKALHECDRYFTDKGRRKGGNSSDFVKVGEEVRKWKNEMDRLDNLVAESLHTEESIAALTTKLQEEQELLVEAVTGIRELEERAARLVHRQSLEMQHQTALEALLRIDARHRELRDAESLVTRLEQQRTDAKAAIDAAAQVEVKAQDVLDQARRALTDVQERGSQRRNQRKSQIHVELAQLGSRESELRLRRERVAQVLTHQRELNEARDARQTLDADVTFARSQKTKASERRQAAERDVSSAEALHAYGRWRQAVDSTKEAARLSAEAADLRRQAGGAELEANNLDGARVSGLPSWKELEHLQQLKAELDLAEAKLGGGLSLQIRPLKPVELQVSKDGQPATAQVQAVALTIDADRLAQLRIADLVSIEVQAGAPEQRQRAQTARESWKRDGEPVLRNLGIADLASLSARVREDEQAAGNITRLRAEAAGKRQQALDRENRVADLATQTARVEEREQALAGHDRTALERLFATLGPRWELEAETLLKTRRQTLESTVAAEQSADQRLHAKTSQAQDAADRIARAEKTLREILEKAGLEDPASVAAQLDTELRDVEARRPALESELKGLEAEANAEQAGLQRAVDDATARLAAATAARTAKSESFDRVRAELDKATGRLELLRAEWAKLDRTAAEAEVEQRAAALAAVPAEMPVTDVALASVRHRKEDAEKKVADLRDALQKAQWKLESSGGAVARERRGQAKDAWDKAVQAEGALEIEAESWKLLKETLREVENEEGTHLGRALAGPVDQRFAELTRGRYDRIELGPSLRTGGVALSGGASGREILGGLSVGRKDQLATVLRVTIAEQLRSAIVLDDHLVHTDPFGMEWFFATLARVAAKTQVIVMTCRPADYVQRESVGAAANAVNLERAIRGWTADTPAAKAAAG